MKIFQKKFLNRFYKPLLQKYLEKERKYRYKDIRISVLPGVFHPGFFSLAPRDF